MLGIIGATMTVLAVAAFAGIAWLAYSPRFKQRHERDGMIPFLDSQSAPDAGRDTAKRT